MSISCPNKRLVAWKNLVKNVGENKSYVLWAEYDGNVPDKYYESNIQSEQVNQTENKVDFNDLIGSKKNEVVSDKIQEITKVDTKFLINAFAMSVGYAELEKRR